MNPQSLLLRQVHPSWIVKDRATSQAFTPTPKDQVLISTYGGEQITAEASWKHYTGQLGNESVGVLAVTLAECQVNCLPVIPDPTLFQEHILIDLRGFSRQSTKNLAKKLTQYARDRGWQYVP